MQILSYLIPIKRFSPLLVSSAGALTCLASAAYCYYRNYKTEVHEVIMFCTLQSNMFNYFKKLISFMETAKQSINICMPSIRNTEIQRILLEFSKSTTIKIRIMIFAENYNDSTTFFLKQLAEAGVEIKCQVGENRLQHKFCLVDDKVLMTGTVHWGNDLSWNNWNYVIITNRALLVKPVAGEFYRLWVKSTNIKDYTYTE